MGLNYDQLWKLMIDKKINKTQLCKKASISTNAMAKLGKNEPVRIEVLERICSVLDCGLDDITTIKGVVVDNPVPSTKELLCDIRNVDYKILIEELKNKNSLLDAIITDPPYNVSRDYQLGYSNMGRSGMNYGEWDYDFDQTEWIKESVDLVKPGGTVIIFNDWKNLGLIARELEGRGFIVKDIIRWVKRNPMPRNVDRRYVNDCEFAVWAVKEGAKWTFNKPSTAGYLRPEIETGVVPGGKKRLHPTQKHLDVMENLIKIHTNIGDTILDPFLGSGTTALACLNNGRNIIGSEIDEKYYNVTLQRIGR